MGDEANDIFIQSRRDDFRFDVGRKSVFLLFIKGLPYNIFLVCHSFNAFWKIALLHWLRAAYLPKWYQPYDLAYHRSA